MLSWLIPSVIALAALGWAIYQYSHPRTKCMLHYTIENVNNQCLRRVVGMTEPDSEGKCRNKYEETPLLGKVIELRSLGNVAANGILINVRFNYPIKHWNVDTYEAYDEPYFNSKWELSFSVDTLNPANSIQLFVFCKAESVKQGEEVLLEHSVTLSEGVAQKVDKW